ncbi:MAG TPA: sugar ABC transporter ATP-binding protein [Nevskiaceae bacterium]
MTDSATAGNILEARGVRKTYGGVVALQGCDFDVPAGTVHALLGENGAGKSTLVKILTGVVQPDKGVVRLAGKEVRFRDTNDAARSGVAVVSQELNLFPDLDVLANLFLGREQLRGGLFDRRAMQRRAEPVLAELGLHISVRRLLGTLDLAQQQLVEVARALLTNPRVLILDEPTSALDEEVSARLLGVIKVLRDRRVGVVFVSHILEEVMALSDVVTVLRDGGVVMNARPRSELDIKTIVAAMIGNRDEVAEETEVPTPRVSASTPGASALSLVVEGIVVPHRLHAVSMRASQGEIVGLAGLVGAGHRELLEVIAGLRHATAGTLSLPRSPDRRLPKTLLGAVRRGVALVSGDRKRGLLFENPIWNNIAQVRSVALARDGVFLRRPLMRARARHHIRDLVIKAASENQAVGMLSGGNQQKVVIAKWIEAEPSVLLLDDPTRGVGIGSKRDIHRLLRRASATSVVLLCSTDIEELVSICDRILVFRHGRIASELRGDQLTRQRLLTQMNAGGESKAQAAAASA